MEHRCGTRLPTSIRARLGSPSGSLTGRIIDLSLSGAFVALSDPIPEETRLIVDVAGREGFGSTPSRVPAHVVRRSETGVGIEWDTFAPWPVLTLLRRHTCSDSLSTSHSSSVLSETLPETDYA
jgi:hypothetical protein